MADNSRWWENAARIAELQLPASLLNVPRWVFADGETRRLSSGASMRQASVGAGFTGMVLLDALADQLPLSAPDAYTLLGPAMEGPLWLDVAPKAASIEGVIQGFDDGFDSWIETTKTTATSVFPLLDSEQLSQRIATHLPGAQVGGVIMTLAPTPRLAVVMQMSLVDGVLEGLFERLGALAQAQGVGAAATEQLARWCKRFAEDGCRVLDVIVPLDGKELSLRWWNISSQLAMAFVEDADCDVSAPERLARLLKHAAVPDVARAVMHLKIAGNAPSGQLVVDMGLAGY